jgi:hypothetical protein
MFKKNSTSRQPNLKYFRIRVRVNTTLTSVSLRLLGAIGEFAKEIAGIFYTLHQGAKIADRSFPQIAP